MGVGVAGLGPVKIIYGATQWFPEAAPIRHIHPYILPPVGFPGPTTIRGISRSQSDQWDFQIPTRYRLITSVQYSTFQGAWPV